jgi:UDP-N-acetylglucosamine 1-carboxyvinyltransferase
MKFIVKGGKPLEGEVTLSGAKNAATKMMLASLLTEEQCVFSNFPQIGDTEITGELCEKIGSVLHRSGSVMTLQTKEIKNNRVTELSRRNRLPILALGPLLARTGEAEVPVLGGDRIGSRPVDIHVEVLTAMGAEVRQTDAGYHARAPRGLKGATIQLRFPSVGATETALLAAVLAKGTTIIKNAATEPEVMNLVSMLQNMGAIIELGADRVISIEGVGSLRGVHHRVIPDRNEAVSFACLAIATRGQVFVRDAIQEHLTTFLNVVRRLGGEYAVLKEGIMFYRDSEKMRSISIETETNPGFMTDWQQPLAVLLAEAEGDSQIHETIYEDRLGYTDDFNVLGGNIEVFTDCGDFPICRFANQNFRHRAVIHGPTSLRGGELKVRDLRAGWAALLIALVADGETVIEGVEEIDRGYADVDGRLLKLGANIKRIKE